MSLKSEQELYEANKERMCILKLEETNGHYKLIAGFAIAGWLLSYFL